MKAFLIIIILLALGFIAAWATTTPKDYSTESIQPPTESRQSNQSAEPYQIMTPFIVGSDERSGATRPVISAYYIPETDAMCHVLGDGGISCYPCDMVYTGSQPIGGIRYKGCPP